MQLSKSQEKAKAELIKLREKRWKLREISLATGVGVGNISGIINGYRAFSDATAEKILAGAKQLRGQKQ